MRRAESFLRRLERRQAISTEAATARELRRTQALAKRIRQAIDRRYDARHHHTDWMRAAFKKSLERHRLKLLLVAIHHEIDRLRWTAGHRS